MAETKIQWTDHSVNPIRAKKDGTVGHYCELASAGCANCYASSLQKRFKMPAFGSKKNRGSVEVFLDDKKLSEVLKRQKPTKYFWCDMTDMFGEWVPDAWLDRIFGTMSSSNRHTHQVLTKRPDRMADYIAGLKKSYDRLEAGARSVGYTLRYENIPLVPWPIPSVWLGTSVENKACADERIPHLLNCDAEVRFLSVEPLLEYVDLTPYLHGIQWVIVGGESGHDARPCDLHWLDAIVGQCQDAGVACFVKQLGANATDWNGIELNKGATGPFVANRFRDSKGGDPSEWPETQLGWPRQFPTSDRRD